MAHLKSLRTRSLVEFSRDWLAFYAAERGIQIAVQNLLDIGAHILADFGDSQWDEYKQIPVELARYGVVPQEYVERAQRMAGMRNLLVHQYTEIDVDQVYEVLKNHLDDFDRFAAYVKAYLDRSPP